MIKSSFRQLALISVASLGLTACSDTSSNSIGSTSTQFAAAEKAAENVDVTAYKALLPFEIFETSNGLRVILHQNNDNPIVNVSMIFDVGASDEPEGKSGFAHLYEHLLFRGTKNAPGEYFKYTNELGAKGTNGTTSQDKTDYYTTVPTGALERLLWLEGDRFTNAIESVDVVDVQTQIEVVKNEKGLQDNEPFSKAYYESIEALFPKGHPYDHSIIGSVEDLESATMEDVRSWYEEFYGARNAILVIAGDVDVKTAKPLVEKYFGQMAPGPEISQITRFDLVRPANTKQIVRDVAKESYLERTYLFPKVVDLESYTASTSAIGLRNSRNASLRQQLVEENKYATRTSLAVTEMDLLTVVQIEANPAEGVSLDELSGYLDTAVQTYLDVGLTQEEIDLGVSSYKRSIARVAESPVNVRTVLSSDYRRFGDPLRILKEYQWQSVIEPEMLKASASKWFSTGYHEIHYKGLLEAEPNKIAVDFSKPPKIAPTERIDIAKPAEFTLSNGVKVVHHQRKNTGFVEMVLAMPIGDEVVPKTEAYRLQAMAAISSDLKGMTWDEYAEQLILAGARTRNNYGSRFLDYTLSTTPDKLEDALDLWKLGIFGSLFDQAELEIERARQIESFDEFDRDEGFLAETFFYREVLGADNTENIDEMREFWTSVTREDLQATQEKWIKPEGAIIFVVGNVSQDELRTSLESTFSDWKGKRPRDTRPKPVYPKNTDQPRFILIDNPDSTQTKISATAMVDIPKGENPAEQIFNAIVGGGFTSRLNLNIREDKGWTYGINSSLSTYDTYSNFSISSDVTAEYTFDTITEIYAEFNEALTSNPVSQNEFAREMADTLSQFSTNLHTNSSIMFDYFEAYQDGHPYTYSNGFGDRIRDVTLNDVRSAGSRLVDLNSMTWLLHGNLSLFEDKLRAANLGTVEVYDLAGNRVR